MYTIGVVGGSDSGKTTLVKRILKKRSPENVVRRYYDIVRSMHEEFIEKSKNYANILLVGEEVDEKAVILLLVEYCM
jgi:uridine kinase